MGQAHNTKVSVIRGFSKQGIPRPSPVWRSENSSNETQMNICASKRVHSPVPKWTDLTNNPMKPKKKCGRNPENLIGTNAGDESGLVDRLLFFGRRSFVIKLCFNFETSLLLFVTINSFAFRFFRCIYWFDKRV